MSGCMHGCVGDGVCDVVCMYGAVCEADVVCDYGSGKVKLLLSCCFRVLQTD